MIAMKQIAMQLSLLSLIYKWKWRIRSQVGIWTVISLNASRFICVKYRRYMYFRYRQPGVWVNANYLSLWVQKWVVWRSYNIGIQIDILCETADNSVDCIVVSRDMASENIIPTQSNTGLLMTVFSGVLWRPYWISGHVTSECIVSCTSD